MVTYFLDYYHPFAGLCNQLYLITNHIHDAYNKGVELFIHKMNIDIFNKERIMSDQILDITKCNENLKKLTGKSILIKDCPEIIEFIPKLCIYPVSSIPFLNCLEFNENILKNVNKIKSNFKEFYAIHFRLDIDAVIHYTFGKEIYNEFMESTIKVNYFNKLDQKKIENYCNFLIKQYTQFITQFGFDKVWYISTSLTKDPIHDPLLPFLKYITDFIISNKGSYYIPHKIYQQRELNALVDLLILRDSEKLIGFEGSSFSEGYCLKVNSIRKVTKEFLFVKEYPF